MDKDRRSWTPQDDDVVKWFAKRNFLIRTWKDDEGTVWADLLRRDGSTLAPRYGRGPTDRDAILRAKERYLSEQ
jgi:hypothetical protein